MLVVGQKVVSAVRYGVNAGIWGSLKWKDIEIKFRNLQENGEGRTEEEESNQFLMYDNFAKANNRLYPSIWTKYLENTYLKTQELEGYGTNTVKFVSGFTKQKFFLKRYIYNSPKVICKFEK